MSLKSAIARFAMALTLLVGAFAMTAPQPAVAASSSTGCLPGSIKSKLSQIRQKFGSISVISTSRPGARIAGSGKRSYHASCRAADFHPPKGKYRQVVAWLKKNHSGGVGTYSCGMHHIHIDNGPRVRFHHCVNAKGRPVGKSRYASKRSKKKYVGKSKRRYASKKRSNKRSAKASTSKKVYVAKPKAAPKQRVSSVKSAFAAGTY